MTLTKTISSGIAAIIYFHTSSSFGNTDTIEKKLSAFPDRQTAFKIGVIAAKVGFFWAGLNHLAVSVDSAYSVITGHSVLATSNLFTKILKASWALNFTTLALTLFPALYARAWKIT